MVICKTTVFTVIGVALAGFVGYKIVEKKKPEWIESSKKSLSNATEGTSKFFKGAQESFREGYASA